MSKSDFRDPNDPIGDHGSIGEFWKWAMSDLLGNRNRGILAEYLVYKALVEKLPKSRIEWDCFDVEYKGYKIEVKSSAYVQSWHKSPEERSRLSFSVGEHQCWDGSNNAYNTTKDRHAHLYVFCVFPQDRDDPTRDVLDLTKWGFFITTTEHLKKNIQQETSDIGITAVKRICGDMIGYGLLKTKIDNLLPDKKP